MRFLGAILISIPFIFAYAGYVQWLGWLWGTVAYITTLIIGVLTSIGCILISG